MAIVADPRPAGDCLTIDGIAKRPGLPRGNVMNAAGPHLGFCTAAATSGMGLLPLCFEVSKIGERSPAATWFLRLYAATI
jgi:hypothetical protein